MHWRACRGGAGGWARRRRWRRRAQVDTISVGFAVVIFLWLGFREPHRLAFHAPVAYVAVMALLGVIGALPRLALTWCACRSARMGAARVLASAFARLPCLACQRGACWSAARCRCLQAGGALGRGGVLRCRPAAA